MSVLLNGHPHNLLGTETNDKWVNFGLQDQKTSYMSALEVHEDLLKWKKSVKGFVGLVDSAIRIGGSLPDRGKSAIKAFMAEPNRKE